MGLFKLGSMVLFLIGVSLCMLSALSSVIGVNLQKLSHMRNKKEGRRVSYCTQGLWWFGMLLVVLGALLDFVSLGFAPQGVVAVFGSLTLVINAWTAPLILGEKLSRKQFICTLLIFCGAALAVASIPKSHESYSLKDLIRLFKQTSFIVYMCTSLGVCALLAIVFVRAERLCKHFPQSYSLAWSNVHSVSIAALSGILGAQSLLFAKAFVLIVISFASGHGASIVAHAETYVIILSLVLCLVLQTMTLNSALQRFDAVFVMPVFQVFWITTGVIGGGAYYGEFSNITNIELGLGIAGFTIVAAGIWSLTKTRTHQHHQHHRQKHSTGSTQSSVSAAAAVRKKISIEGASGGDLPVVVDVNGVGAGLEVVSPREVELVLFHDDADEHSSGGGFNSGDSSTANAHKEGVSLVRVPTPQNQNDSSATPPPTNIDINTNNPAVRTRFSQSPQIHPNTTPTQSPAMVVSTLLHSFSSEFPRRNEAGLATLSLHQGFVSGSNNPFWLLEDETDQTDTEVEEPKPLNTTNSAEPADGTHNRRSSGGSDVGFGLTARLFARSTSSRV